MGDSLMGAVVTVATALIGVAIIATLVSRNANTSGVIGAGGNAFSSGLRAATGPVTGGTAFGGLSPLTFSGGAGY